MECNILKELMRRHIGDIVDSEKLEYLFTYGPHDQYTMPHLLECIVLADTYPNLCDYVEEYLNIYGKEDNILGNVNQVCYNNNVTALHLACGYSKKENSEKLVEILIRAGANVNIKNDYNETPLHWALHEYKNSYRYTNEGNFGTQKLENTYSKNIIVMLIKAGANNIFHIRDNFNETAYDLIDDKLKNYLQFDKKTNTWGILTGSLTKPANKKINF